MIKVGTFFIRVTINVLQHNMTFDGKSSYRGKVGGNGVVVAEVV